MWQLWVLALLGACGACSADSAGSSPSGPTTAAEAAGVFDLTKFPLAKGAEKPAHQTVAGLSYQALGTVKDVFEFQRKQLTEQKWNELPGSYISDQSATAAFGRDGFSLSVMVSPTSKEGAVSVSILNHGNIALGKLPLPEGTKPFYSGPVNASFITTAPVAQTAEECRKLLVEKGWVPYGGAGDVQDFKQNAIRLAVRVMAAPAQGGKTVIDYSTLLMSVDLPAPPDAEDLRYSDTPVQLFFDTPLSAPEVADFFRQALGKASWEATTENLIQIDFKKIMIFRNPPEDMLTLEVTDVDGKTRILLKHLSGAQVAELDRLIEEDQARKKAMKDKPLPKLTLRLPDGASEVAQTKSRLEFQLPAGNVKAVLEGWRKQFAADGWKEGTAVLEDLAGSISFSKDDQDVSVTYDDTGVLPAEITVRARGVELEK